jgi:hypothetical protein
MPGIPLPPQPVLTRWGTWLDAAMYYADNFEGSGVICLISCLIRCLRSSILFGFRHVTIDLQLDKKQTVHILNICCFYIFLFFRT